MAAILELTDIRKSYGEENILAGVSLAVRRGAAVAITGESGEGKTALLSIMGLLQSAEGRVVVDGQDVSGFDQQSKAMVRGRYFGYIFQRARLISSLTAIENVMLPGWLAKTGGNLEKKAKELLGRLGMAHRLHYKPQELSLGQLRRVALARALILEPPIVLADEPTNDLDPQLAKTVADCLFEARDSGAGVVIVTHDRALAARADRMYRLERGRLFEDVTAQTG
jgi:lipoprotein-releasing system ATP-binding protein